MAMSHFITKSAPPMPDLRNTRERASHPAKAGDRAKWSGRQRVAFIVVAAALLWAILIGVVVFALGLLG